jgi:rubrerythrin
MFTLRDLLDIAVKLEENGEAVYRRSLAVVSDPALKSLLTWMADEESSHREHFSAVKAALSLSGQEESLRKMAPEVLEGMMGHRTLSLEDVDFGGIRSVRDLLSTSITFEKDSILFYELLEITVEDPETLAGIREIAAEEKRHVDSLEKMIRALDSGEIADERIGM